jgi:hypothetical protein
VGFKARLHGACQHFESDRKMDLGAGECIEGGAVEGARGRGCPKARWQPSCSCFIPALRLALTSCYIPPSTLPPSPLPPFRSPDASLTTLIPPSIQASSSPELSNCLAYTEKGLKHLNCLQRELKHSREMWMAHFDLLSQVTPPHCPPARRSSPPATHARCGWCTSIFSRR